VPGDLGITNDPANDANCPFNGTCTFTGTFFVPGQTNHGVYGAVDVLTGKVAWKVPVTPQPDSGVGVAGDLVFFGDSNGIFYAAHAATGKILWTFDSSTVANAGGATASPAIYVVDGREYVVYGFGGNPGESPKLGDAVIAFALPDEDN
jgi:glucose dehydrogenase